MPDLLNILLPLIPIKAGKKGSKAKGVPQPQRGQGTGLQQPAASWNLAQELRQGLSECTPCMCFKFCVTISARLGSLWFTGTFCFFPAGLHCTASAHTAGNISRVGPCDKGPAVHALIQFQHVASLSVGQMLQWCCSMLTTCILMGKYQ